MPDKTSLPPGFDEPWQAQVHAMAQVLQESGRISPTGWSETLGEAIRRRLAAGEADTTETYYRAMTDALERVLGFDDDEIRQLVAAWRDAYAETPHGKPVALKNSP